MGTLTILALRIVIALALAGSLIVQVVMMPLVWTDLAGTDDSIRILLIVLMIALIVTMQITAVCVWQLLTMVRRGSVFSAGAFRYVDIVIGAVALASVLVLIFAVVLAPGDAAPGFVALVCGAALVVAGVALIVTVLRLLLAQAVARDTEARNLRSELNEVI